MMATTLPAWFNVEGELGIPGAPQGMEFRQGDSSVHCLEPSFVVASGRGFDRLGPQQQDSR